MPQRRTQGMPMAEDVYQWLIQNVGRLEQIEGQRVARMNRQPEATAEKTQAEAWLAQLAAQIADADGRHPRAWQSRRLFGEIHLTCITVERSALWYGVRDRLSGPPGLESMTR